jgi:hypothetical protein
MKDTKATEMTEHCDRNCGRVAILVAVALSLIGSAMITLGLRGDTPPQLSAAVGQASDRPTHSAHAGAVASTVISPTLPSSGVSSRTRTLKRSRPVYLDIPRVGIRTDLIELGLNDDGAVEVPPLRSRAPAGWYKHAASPGEIGPAVILGHVDSRQGRAVFFRLAAIRLGDVVLVRRVDGITAIFIVDFVARYPKTAFPTGAVYGHLDYPGLRLITCGGHFDRSNDSYRDNIIVFARFTGSHRRSDSGSRPLS